MGDVDQLKDPEKLVVENVPSPSEDASPSAAAPPAESTALVTETPAPAAVAPAPVIVSSSPAGDAGAPAADAGAPAAGAPAADAAGAPPADAGAPPANAGAPAADGGAPAADAGAPAADAGAPAADAAAPTADGAAPAKEEAPPPADGQAPTKKTPEEEKADREYAMYLAMAKSLTLQLPFERDRVIASKWVKKIERSEDDLPQRLNYLKLLSVSMFSHKLAGPFQYVPKDSPELDDIGNLSSNDIINELVEQRNPVSTPPYFVEISGDLKEYAAYQEIPDFGAHFYYAFSNETVVHWHNEKRAIVPSGGINYPIFEPPVKHISTTAEAFKSAYMEYAQADSVKLTNMPSDLKLNMMPELRKRKLITNNDITRMGTKKFIRDSCKCPPAPNVNQNRAPKTSVRGKPASGNTPTNGRPCNAVRQARC